MPKPIAIAVIAILGWSALASPARAQDKFFEWKNATSGNWSAANRWNAPQGETVPNGNSHLANFNLQNVAAYTASLDLDATVKDFYLGSASGTVLIGAGKTLTTTTSGRIQRNGGTMELRGTYRGPLQNAATIKVGPGGGTPIVAVIESSAFMQTGTLTITADSQGQIQGSTYLAIRGGSFESSGTITVNVGNVGAELNLERPQVGPGNLGDYYTLTNSPIGTINFQGQATSIWGSQFTGNLTNKGTINITNGIQFFSPSQPAGPGQPARIGGVYSNVGMINVKTGDAIGWYLTGDRFDNTTDNEGRKGVIDGTGTIHVDGLANRKLVNVGAKIKVKGAAQQSLLQLGPGPSLTPDLLNIVGDYDQIDGATLEPVINASSASIRFGQLNVDGIAYLTPDASIELSLLDDAYLQPGQQFPVLVAQTLSGACPEISIPGLDGHWPSVYYNGHYYSVNCDTPNTVTLQVDSIPEPATLWTLVLFAVAGSTRHKPARRDC
jgi:hypothetical protein